MKRLLLLFCLIPSLLSAQDSIKKYTLLGVVPFIDGQVRYIEVVNVEGVKKDALYNRAKKWIAETYRSSKDVVQLDNKEAGEVIAKGYFGIEYKHPLYFGLVHSKAYHIIRIQFKDEKYRYDIEIPEIVNGTTYQYEGTPYKMAYDFNEKNAKRLLSGLDIGVKTVISSLINSMKNKSDTEKDW